MTPLNFVGVISFILLSYSNLLRTVGQVSPVFFRIQNGTGADTCAIIGFFTALLGVVIEGASDAQKFRLKKEHPHEFCSGPGCFYSESHL